jgi:oligoribonuclease
MPAADRLVWIDLEMTGLDPAQHHIIEIATLITDGSLEIVAEGPDLVIHQPDSVLEGMNDWCTEHHTASGLVDKVRASTVSLAEAEALTLELVQAWCTAGTAPLAGNSIHVDRFFLRHHMPKLEAHLHYRNVDVTSIKELARRWLPKTFAKAPRKSDSHRALDDIRESIAELCFYRDNVFKKDDLEAT